MRVASPWPHSTIPYAGCWLNSDRATFAQEQPDVLRDIVPCIVVDGLVVAKRERALHDLGRMFEVAVDPVLIELDRGLARDVAANDRPCFDIGGLERAGELADLEWCVAAHLEWEAEPGVLALWGFILEVEEVAVL